MRARTTILIASIATLSRLARGSGWRETRADDGIAREDGDAHLFHEGDLLGSHFVRAAASINARR
eukprot:31159-Pelagococcus_subviridis.AAC.4